ncbi:MAG: hypothetical protein GY862_02535, partial [Gammaproteobacteria bacterium]|nr:hypothetical protein [Gammaproteobacteria bacterium]
ILPLSLSMDKDRHAAKIRKDLKRNHMMCNVLLIVYGKSTPDWVREQLRTYLQHDTKRKEKMKAVAVYEDKSEDTKPPLGFSLPELVLLECPTLKAPDCMPKFVKRIEK